MKLSDLSAEGYRFHAASHHPRDERGCTGMMIVTKLDVNGKNKSYYIAAQHGTHYTDPIRLTRDQVSGVLGEKMAEAEL